MADLPTQLANPNIETGPSGALGPAEGLPSFGEKAGSLLGGGIEKVGLGVERYSIYRNRSLKHFEALKQKQTDQDETLEVSKKVSEMRNTWNQHLQEAQDAPSENQLDITSQAFSDYSDGLIKSGSSKRVQDELQVHAQEFQTHVLQTAHTIQSQARQANFAGSLSKMLSDGEDSIFSSKSLDELQAQKKLFNDTIDGAVNTGRIKDTAIIQNLRDKANQFNVSWAEANIADNPDFVKQVVNSDEFKGTPIRDRENLLEKADRVIQTNGEYSRVALGDALQSDIIQRMKTGEGNSLNLDAYQKVHGKAARDDAEIELNNATRLHGVIEGVKGASTETLQSILDSAQPHTKTEDYNSLDTKLNAEEESKFQEWKKKYAPNDSGYDYDLRGAYKAGITPSANGHWPDTFKKPNHPTFSNQSKFASQYSSLAGSWNDDTYVPSKASKNYALQQKYAEQVGQVVQQAVADKKNDAFTYYAQNPALKSLVQDVMRKNMERKKGQDQLDTSAIDSTAQDNLRHAVLQLQKMDKSLSPADYKAMPDSDAKQFVDQFNGLTEVGSKTDGAGVRDMLAQFTNRYKDDLPIAVNQLSNIKGGDKVSAEINPLMWHLNNPTTFRMTLDALRKDNNEQMARFTTEKEKKNFLTDNNMDKSMLAYQASMTSANNSPEAQKLVNGVQKAFQAFSRDYVLNGGKQKDASSIFFQNYSFGTANGVPYARPNNYTDALGNQHTMTDDQISYSNGHLNAMPQFMNPDDIDPSSLLNRTNNFTPEQIRSDMHSALRHNVFWSTTGDETGVYLFTKGTVNGTAKQVMHKDGTPVRVNFIDTLPTGKSSGRAIQDFINMQSRVVSIPAM